MSLSILLPVRALAILAGLLLAFGCSGGGSSSVTPGAGLPVLFEAEPNDFAIDANFLGFLRPGDHFLIEGVIGQAPFDAMDGFAFVAEVPCEVFFSLVHDNHGDLDLRVYDPFVEDFVAFFETEFNPELGSIFVHDPNVEFHAVVLPFIGFGAYTLEVSVQPLPLFASLALEGAEQQDARASLEASQTGSVARAQNDAAARRYRGQAQAAGLPGHLLELDQASGELRVHELDESAQGVLILER